MMSFVLCFHLMLDRHGIHSPAFVVGTIKNLIGETHKSEFSRFVIHIV